MIVMISVIFVLDSSRGTNNITSQ